MMSDSPISRYANILLIIVATFVVHGHVLDRFWLNDDPQVLLHAFRHSPIQVAFDQSAWQELSGSNFTPVVTWSFDADLALFGLDPVAFYLHQVLAVALGAIALHLLMLQLGIGRKSSLLLAMLYLVAPPTIHLAGQLMTRHYLEGLIAALLSVMFWVRATREIENGWLLILSGAFAYLVALLAKEVYGPLPLVLIALSSSHMTLKRLVIRLTPFAAAAAVYIAWRWWILGGGGGYGEEHIFGHLESVSKSWAVGNPVTAAWLASLIAIAGSTWLHTRANAARFVLMAIAATAPLVGVGDALEPRHLLVPSVVALAGAVSGLSFGERGRFQSMLTAIVIISGVGAALVSFRTTSNGAARMESEGRYVWNAGASDAPLFASSPGWYLEGIADLDRIWRNQTSPDVVYSLAGRLMRGTKTGFVTFDGVGDPHLDYLDDTSELESYRAAEPIELEITRDGRTLRWTFGPECDCEWYFYSYPYYQMFSVPRAGSRVVPLPLEQQWFRIERRKSNDEWTLSPPLPLPDEGETMRWERIARHLQENH